MKTVVFSERVLFHDDLQVMEVDFTNVIVSDTSEVNHFYDEIERRIEATGAKWFFLVNYKNCKILPDAWFAFAHRGKKLNLAHSLGTVRFATPDATGQEILEKSRQDDFDPNLFVSRDEALAAIARMRAELEAKGVRIGRPSETPAPEAGSEDAPVHVGTHFPRQVHLRRHPILVSVRDPEGNHVDDCILTLSLRPDGSAQQVVHVADTAEPQGWYRGTQDRVVLTLERKAEGGRRRFLTAIPFDNGLDETIDVRYILYDGD
ncbi:MAG: hypothetical protein H6907_16250 [Hyphomicrobiales bacterium]|nr:hypothetical protein [Hyphomicrobiales bacterium]MCP5373278.1 hypothetical protein [Hyphomicrobiales bacterium]